LPSSLSIADLETVSRVWPEFGSEQTLGGGRQGICTPQLLDGNPELALNVAHRKFIIAQRIFITKNLLGDK